MASDKVVPPGGEGSVDVTLKTGRHQGKLNKTVTVTTNDPENSKLTLAIAANIIVEFAIEPPSLYMGRTTKKDTVTKTAKILAKEPDKLQITNIEPSVEFLEAKVVPTTETKPAEGNPEAPKPPDKEGTGALESKLTLEVVLKPGMKVGRFNEKITMTTNVASVPSYVLNVSGEVMGDINIEPRMVSFRRGDQTDSSSKQVKITTNEPTKTFNITKAEVSDPNFTATVEATEKGKSYVVTVNLNKDAPEKFIRGDLVLALDDPEQPEIKVPVYASLSTPPDKAGTEKFQRVPPDANGKVAPMDRAPAAPPAPPAPQGNPPDKPPPVNP